MGNYSDKIKRFFPFTMYEFRNLIITIILIGFMFGFNDGNKDFVAAKYMYNMIVSMAIATVCMIVYVSGQRLAGLTVGYKVEFQMWWPGMILALLLTFITRGYVWVPIAGGVMLHHMAAHRLGYFRYGNNMLDNGVISAMGPLAVVFFATLVKQLSIWIFTAGSIPGIVDKLYWFSLIFALVNMLPIPPLCGSKLFYHSRIAYMYVFGFIVAYVVLAAFSFYSYIIAAIIAFALWIGYYVRFEAKKYGGY